MGVVGVVGVRVGAVMVVVVVVVGVSGVSGVGGEELISCVQKGRSKKEDFFDKNLFFAIEAIFDFW